MSRRARFFPCPIGPALPCCPFTNMSDDPEQEYFSANEVATGSHLWAERYDRALADVFAVQDETAPASLDPRHNAAAQALLEQAIASTSIAGSSQMSRGSVCAYSFAFGWFCPISGRPLAKTSNSDTWGSAPRR
jgi:hypothetical protein